MPLLKFHKSCDNLDRSHLYPELVHRGPVRFDPALRTAGELIQAPDAKTQVGEADSVRIRHESRVDRHAA